MITSISQETIRSFSDKYYKPLAKKDLPDKTIHCLLPELLKKLGFVVKARKNNPATLEITKSMCYWAIAIILQSKASVPPHTVTREELDSMRGPLPYYNWSIKSMINNIDPVLTRCLEENTRFVCTHPVPNRTFSNTDIVPEIFEYCRASLEPINPALLDQLFEDAAAITQQNGHRADTATTTTATTAARKRAKVVHPLAETNTQTRTRYSGGNAVAIPAPAPINEDDGAANTTLQVASEFIRKMRRKNGHKRHDARKFSKKRTLTRNHGVSKMRLGLELSLATAALLGVTAAAYKNDIQQAVSNSDIFANLSVPTLFAPTAPTLVAPTVTAETPRIDCNAIVPDGAFCHDSKYFNRVRMFCGPRLLNTYAENDVGSKYHLEALESEIVKKFM